MPDQDLEEKFVKICKDSDIDTSIYQHIIDFLLEETQPAQRNELS